MTELVTDNLHLLAGAPSGISGVRGLILDLALRGKLTCQDASDAPATELLGQIHAERAELVAAGSIRKAKDCPTLDADALPSVVPNGWEWASLASLVVQITDGTHHTPTYLPSGIPFISVKDLDGKSVDFRNCKYISPQQHAEINARCNPELGDILLCRIGTLGRPTIVDTNRPFSIFVSVGLLKLPKLVQISRYLHAALSSPLLYRQYDQIKAGGSHTNKLNLGDIPQLMVPVPPLAEQHRIVAKVDELMALCDRLEAEQADAEAAHAKLVEVLLASLTQARDAADFRASWQQLDEHFHTLFTTEASIDALKQTVLQLGVMGRLVPQLSSDEPASVLLERANQARQLQSKLGRSPKSSPSTESSDDEMLFELPAGWVWTRKGNVLHFLNGYAFKSEWFKPEGTRLLRNVNIAHGSIDWKECASIDPDQAAEFGDFQLQANDLVLTLDRPIISTGLKAAIVKEADLPCLLLQRVARISSFADCIATSYLFIWLNSPFFTRSIDPGRSNGVPHISTAQVAKMPFALPPLAEQERIVAKVDELLNLCDQLKLDLTRSRQHHEHLASTLVERAAA